MGSYIMGVRRIYVSRGVASCKIRWESLVVSCMLRVARCELLVASSQVASFGLPVASCEYWKIVEHNFSLSIQSI